MMLARNRPTLPTALPNLRVVTLSESLRLVLIVSSLSFVVLAGQLAHSHSQNYSQNYSQELSETGANQMVGAAHAEAVRPVATTRHQLTPSEHFALTQIKTFSDLLDTLTDRAETLIAVAPTEGMRLKTSLQLLDEDLMTARNALTSVKKSNAAAASKDSIFLEEDLRSSLIALQDSASRAEGDVISLDRKAEQSQGFRVSLMGQ